MTKEQPDKKDVSLLKYLTSDDRPITRLIVKMNFLPFLETYFSCGGHLLGSHLVNYGGIAFHVKKDDKNGAGFLKELRLLVDLFDFATLLESSEVKANPYTKELPDTLLCQIKIRRMLYRSNAYQSLEEMYNQTYLELYRHLEKVVDKWLERLAIDIDEEYLIVSKEEERAFQERYRARQLAIRETIGEPIDWEQD